MENEQQKSELTISNVSIKQNPFIEGSVSKIGEVFDELNKLSLITPNEVSTLEKAQTFLLSTYTDVPTHRTYIDKCVGVLTNARFPTPDSKYWQCKKEAEVQFYELTKEIFTYKRAMVTMKELLYKKQKLQESIKENKVDDPFLAECEVEKISISLADININIKKIEKEIKFRIVEIGDWLSISLEWEPEMKHSKDIYSEHNTESLFNWIDSQMKDAEMRNDKQSYENFKDQKNTFVSLLNRKVNKIIKK
jgi:hypothetical protein